MIKLSGLTRLVCHRDGKPMKDDKNGTITVGQVIVNILEQQPLGDVGTARLLIRALDALEPGKNEIQMETAEFETLEKYLVSLYDQKLAGILVRAVDKILTSKEEVKNIEPASPVS